MNHLTLRKYARLDRFLHPIFAAFLLAIVVGKRVAEKTFYSVEALFRLPLMAILLVLTFINCYQFKKLEHVSSYLVLRIVLYFFQLMVLQVEAYNALEKSVNPFLTAIYLLVTSIDVISVLSLVEQNEANVFRRLKERMPERVFSRPWTIAKVPLRVMLNIQSFCYTWVMAQFICTAVIESLSIKEEVQVATMAILGLFFFAVICIFNLLSLVGTLKKTAFFAILFYRIYRVGIIVFRICIASRKSNRPELFTSLQFHLSTTTIEYLCLILSNFFVTSSLRWITFVQLEATLPLGQLVPFYSTVGLDYSEKKTFYDFENRQGNDVKKFLREIKISKKQLTLGDEIGRGNFSVVYKGSINKFCGKESTVAVKISNVEHTLASFTAQLSELKIMHVIDNSPFLVTLVGVTEIDGNCAIITDFCINGDLHSYLQKLAPSSLHADAARMFGWAEEVACAMNYLSSRSIVHGDLAARNVLLDVNLRCKVSDFGMSLTLYNYEVYTRTNFKVVPYQWMAPEALKDLKFSVQSDVYSYGVLLWEIFSYGEIPWEFEESPYNLLLQLDQGTVLQRPSFCKKAWYNDVMKLCWCILPADRPTFEDLLHKVTSLKEDCVREWFIGV